MKTLITGITGASILFTTVVASAITPSPAGNEDILELISPDNVPRYGTFWIEGHHGITAPLPFVPPDFAQAPIYALPNGQFLVDAIGDTSEGLTAAAEYVLSLGANAPEEELTAEMGPMGAGGPNGPQFDSDVLHFVSLTSSNGFLVFNIAGLIPGDTYLLTRKTVLDDNFTNYWVPQGEFVATASNQVVTIPQPSDSPTGFYLAVDWTLYQGPQPVLVSPTNNSTAGGTGVVVQGTLTDIFPPKSAQLLVDGVVVQTITSGRLRFTFDSTSVGNSSHTVRIVVTSQIWYDPTNGYITPSPVDPTYSFPFDSATAANSVMTSNFLAISSAPYAATADYGQAVFGIDTSVRARVNLAISDGPTNTAFKHISVTNDSPGTISVAWDLTRDDSSAVPFPARYYATITAQALTGGAGPQPADAGSNNTKVIWVSLVKFAHLGQLAVFRTELENIGINGNQQDLAQAACDEEWNASLITPNDPADGLPRGPNPRNVVVFHSNAEYLQFWTYATNSTQGEIEYVGHSRPEDGAFGSGDDAYGSTHIIDPDEVEANLGNSYNSGDGSYSFNNRKAFVRIEGCSSGMAHMNWYFGTPDTPKPGMSPSVWLGWNVSYIYHGAWGLLNSPFEKHIYDFQGWWNVNGFGGVSVRTAIANSFGSMGHPEYIPYRVVRGDQNMRWAY